MAGILQSGLSDAAKARGRQETRHLHALDLFQHLEHALGRVDEQALERLAQATAFKGVAAHEFTLSHDILQ